MCRSRSLEPPVVPMSIFRSRKKVMIFRYGVLFRCYDRLRADLRPTLCLGELDGRFALRDCIDSFVVKTKTTAKYC